MRTSSTAATHFTLCADDPGPVQAESEKWWRFAGKWAEPEIDPPMSVAKVEQPKNPRHSCNIASNNARAVYGHKTRPDHGNLDTTPTMIHGRDLFVLGPDP